MDKILLFTPKSLRFINKNAFCLGSLLLIFLFMVSRLPYFLYYTVPGINPDSSSYLIRVKTILSGSLPAFSDRTPGYPVFLLLCQMFSEKYYFVVVCQNMLSLMAAFIFLWLAYRNVRPLTIPVAIAVGAFVFSGQNMCNDTAILTESIFTSFLLLTFALLLEVVFRQSKWAMVACSSSMAICILIRPVAMFFMVVMALLIGMMLIWRCKLKEIMAMLLPFLVILLILASYNYSILGVFSVSPWGEANLISATATFLEESPNFPPELNESIRNAQNRLSEEDRNTVFNSWNHEDLRKIFIKYYGYSRVLGPTHLKGKSYMDIRGTLRQVSTHAIKSNPKIYLKFFITMMRTYFSNITIDGNIYSSVYYRYKLLFVDRNYAANNSEEYRKFFLKEFYSPDSADFPVISYDSEREKVVVHKTILRSLHDNLFQIYKIIFRNIIWIYIYFLLLMASIIRLIFSRFQHKGTAYLFLMLISTFGAAMTVSLVEYALIRYSYPLEFTYYIGFALGPLLLLPNDRAKWRFYKYAFISKFYLVIKKPKFLFFYAQYYLKDLYYRFKGNAAVVVSYSKSGRTWLEALSVEALKIKYNEKNLSYESTLQSLRSNCPELPYLTFTHAKSSWESIIYDENEVTEISEKKYRGKKVVLLHRDPRDVLVSCYYHIKFRTGMADLSREELVGSQIIGIKKIVNFMRAWFDYSQNHDNVLLISFESLKTDGMATLKTFFEFIEIKDIDEEIIAQALKQCEFKKMHEKERKGAASNPWFSPKDKDDPRSFKTRSGKSGEYANFFSAEELNIIEGYMKARLPKELINVYFPA